MAAEARNAIAVAVAKHHLLRLRVPDSVAVADRVVSAGLELQPFAIDGVPPKGLSETLYYNTIRENCPSFYCIEPIHAYILAQSS